MEVPSWEEVQEARNRADELAIAYEKERQRRVDERLQPILGSLDYLYRDYPDMLSSYQISREVQKSIERNNNEKRAVALKIAEVKKAAREREH